MNMPTPSNDPQMLHRALELANERINSLESDRDRLLELVKRLEYCDQDEHTGLGYCPICGKGRGHGIHPEDCELATIVKEVEQNKQRSKDWRTNLGDTNGTGS